MTRDVKRDIFNVGDVVFVTTVVPWVLPLLSF